MIEGLILTKLTTFPSEKGPVYQSLGVNDEGYVGFGESYFSFIFILLTEGKSKKTRFC